MKVHIWCPRASDSAVSIRNSFRDHGIEAHKTRVDQTDRQLQRFLRRVRRGDLWINYGSPYISSPYLESEWVARNLKTLNTTSFLNKRSQLLKLAKNDVPTLEVSDKPKNGFIGRSMNHEGGTDLLTESGHDYYTKKLEFTREVRVHIYKGKAIHTGLKVALPNAHPWIRSYEGGWRIDYSRSKDVAQSRRDLAKKAIAALGLDFGAVDIGVLKGDNAVVLEVNTAPGIEGETLEAYMDQFMSEVTQVAR